MRCLTAGGDWGPCGGPGVRDHDVPRGEHATAPAGLAVVVNGPTSATLTWSDQSGGTASTLVKRSAVQRYKSPSWSQGYLGFPGVTTWTDTGLSAQNAYQYRLRASNAAGTGEYGMPTIPPVWTSSTPSVGGPQTINVGPGQTYTSIAAAASAINAMGPGDTLRIHCNTDGSGNLVPYYERLMLMARGTAAAPVTVVGVPDPATGAVPVLDGTNATTAAAFVTNYTLFETFSLVLVGPQSTYNPPPGYLDISHLELRNAKHPGTFTDFTGVTMTWDYAASGVYLQSADHVTLHDCLIHDTGNGIFSDDKGEFVRYIGDVTVYNCTLYNQGNTGRQTEHGLYLQGLRSTVYGCKLGPITPNTGVLLKDRGAGTVVYANRFLPVGTHHLDLVEVQDSPYDQMLPSVRRAVVFGNLFQSDGSVSTSIHYGYDHYNPMAGRKGLLHFYNNTFVTIYDGSGTTGFGDDRPGAGLPDRRPEDVGGGRRKEQHPAHRPGNDRARDAGTHAHRAERSGLSRDELGVGEPRDLVQHVHRVRLRAVQPRGRGFVE